MVTIDKNAQFTQHSQRSLSRRVVSIVDTGKEGYTMKTLRVVSGKLAHAPVPLTPLLLRILIGGAAGVVAGGCGDASTPTAPGTQLRLVAQEAPSQPTGRIFSAEIVDGKARNHTTWDLPASAFSSAPFMQEPKPQAPPGPSRRLALRCRRMSTRHTPTGPPTSQSQ